MKKDGTPGKIDRSEYYTRLELVGMLEDPAHDPVLGIDPGKEGGVAILDEAGGIITTTLIPCVGSDIDIRAIRDMLPLYDDLHVTLELQQVRQGQGGNLTTGCTGGAFARWWSSRASRTRSSRRRSGPSTSGSRAAPEGREEEALVRGGPDAVGRRVQRPENRCQLKTAWSTLC